MLKYFSQHLMKFFMPRDSFSETTVTPKDPSSKIFNHFQNIIVAFLEKVFFLEKYFSLNKMHFFYLKHDNKHNK